MHQLALMTRWSKLIASIILSFAIAITSALAQTATQDEKTPPPAKKFSDQPAEVIELKNTNPDKIPKPATTTPPTNQSPENASGLRGTEILSDTQGVDFGPFLKRVHTIVQHRFDVEIPPVARPPILKSGTAVIRFAIMKSGVVQSAKIEQSSGDASMDHAAWGTLSFGPLPPLPPAFKGDYIELRGYFYFNPPKAAPAPAKDKN